MLPAAHILYLCILLIDASTLNLPAIKNRLLTDIIYKLAIIKSVNYTTFSGWTWHSFQVLQNRVLLKLPSLKLFMIGFHSTSIRGYNLFWEGVILKIVLNLSYQLK